ncbi:MAG: c-type cytochrome domain-containing protein [Akkermansiaceae bacterium]
MKVFRILGVLGGAILLCGELRADQPEGVEDFILDYCADCHDRASKKGGLDLESLSFELGDRENFAHWVKAYDQVADGMMPPKKKISLLTRRKRTF